MPQVQPSSNNVFNRYSPDDYEPYLDALTQQARNTLKYLQSGRATHDDLRAFRHWRQQSPEHMIAARRAEQLYADQQPGNLTGAEAVTLLRNSQHNSTGNRRWVLISLGSALGGFALGAWAVKAGWLF